MFNKIVPRCPCLPPGEAMSGKPAEDFGMVDQTGASMSVVKPESDSVKAEASAKEIQVTIVEEAPTEGGEIVI